MITFFVIIGIIVLGLGTLAYFSKQSRRRYTFDDGSLKPLERSLFAHLANGLSGNAARPLIPQQIAQLPRGERFYFPKSYHLELFSKKENPIPADMLFERRDEFRLATISFTVFDVKYKAEFGTYDGRVWGMTVRPNPKKVFGRSVDAIDQFTLNNDPMEKIGEIVVENFPAGSTFNGALGSLAQQYPVSEVQRPLPEQQREALLRRSEAKLPTDLIDLLDQTNGFTIGGVQVHGLGWMQSVSLEDGSYLVIAEKEGGCLVIKKSKKKGTLKYYSYEDENAVRALGNGFLIALDAFMKIS